MFKYKGYIIPNDIFLMLFISWRVIFYYNRSKTMTSLNIIRNITNKSKNIRKISEWESHLRKIYKLVSFIYKRILKNTKPCLVRSYILLEEALKLGVNAQIYIGVIKNDEDIEGHSWLMIDDVIFLENEDYINNYTVIAKG